MVSVQWVDQRAFSASKMQKKSNFFRNLQRKMTKASKIVHNVQFTMTGLCYIQYYNITLRNIK